MSEYRRNPEHLALEGPAGPPTSDAKDQEATSSTTRGLESHVAAYKPAHPSWQPAADLDLESMNIFGPEDGGWSANPNPDRTRTNGSIGVPTYETSLAGPHADNHTERTTIEEDYRENGSSSVSDVIGGTLGLSVETQASPVLAGGFEPEIDVKFLANSDGFQINAEKGYEGAGYSVAGAGDVNGDGFDDLIIGTCYSYPYGYFSGRAHVVFGSANGIPSELDLSTLNGKNGFQINGSSVGDFTATDVASAGDINGDGFDDIIVGSPTATPSGAAFVIFGKPGAFASSIDLTKLTGKNGFEIKGEKFGDGLGNSVASAGDINGDGLDDFLIGAPTKDAGDSDTGAAYVVFGKTGGFGSELDLSSLNGLNGFQINGLDYVDWAGVSVASAGDVNGDGFDDCIIGASNADPEHDWSWPGEAYVIFGKSSGFSANFNLSKLNGSNGFRITSDIDFAGVGGSVSAAGDINGDGYDDVIVGAAFAGPDGSAFVVFGSANGFDATLDVASLDGTNGFSIIGESISNDAGDAVSSAGDINGDGLSDILVGAPWSNPNGASSGAAYVIFGTTEGFEAVLNLNALDGTNGFQLSGESDGDHFGDSVASAGDVNGDGLDDILVGASGASVGPATVGSAFVVYGRGPGVATAGKDILSGTSGSDVLSGLDGDDSIFGGSGSDLLRGGAGHDLIDGGKGVDELYGGGGNDTIVVNATTDSAYGGSGIDLVSGLSFNLNLSSDAFDQIENASVTGTKNLNLTGTQDANTLTGNSADNVLKGAGGVDVMLGGAGDDTYISNGDDTITEGAGQGTDIIESSASCMLEANVENLSLTGSGSIRGTGNALANIITGNSGANKLDGSTGKDILTGGSGEDQFIFSAALGSSNADQITDFDIADDTIRLENAIFKGLDIGTLKASAFSSNSTGNATDDTDRIIYEKDSGRLFFDKDGEGGAGKMYFATIDKGLDLTHKDFVVF